MKKLLCFFKKQKITQFFSWDCLYTFLLAILPFPGIGKYYYILLLLCFSIDFIYKFFIKKNQISIVSIFLLFFAAIYGFICAVQGLGFSFPMALWLASLALLYNSDQKTIFWSYFVSLFFFFSILIIAALTGIVENHILNGHNYLGFENPNTASMVAFNLISVYLFLRREHTTYFEILIIALFVLFIYFEAGSETFLAVSIVEIFFTILNCVFSQQLRSLRSLPKLLEFLPFIFATASFIFISLYRYNAGLFGNVGLSLSWRLSYIGENGLLNSLSLFGFGSTNYGPLDNSYAFSLITNGIVGFLLMTFYYSYTLRIANQRRSFFVFMLVVCILIYGIAESTAARLPYTSALLFLLDKNIPNDSKNLTEKRKSKNLGSTEIEER